MTAAPRTCITVICSLQIADDYMLREIYAGALAAGSWVKEAAYTLCDL